jgi:hypothetical protein
VKTCRRASRHPSPHKRSRARADRLHGWGFNLRLGGSESGPPAADHGAAVQLQSRAVSAKFHRRRPNRGGVRVVRAAERALQVAGGSFRTGRATLHRLVAADAWWG